MKRTQTFWQAFVLFLAFTMAVGIYTLVAVAWRQVRTEDRIVVSGTPVQAGAIQITSPLDGAVVQPSGSVDIRVVFTEPGFRRAELQVDGVGVAVEANPTPQEVPWVVHWVWDATDVGARELTVRAQRSQEDWLTSAAVVVSVVPEGQLLFSSNRDGAYAIYRLDTDGSDLSRLTPGPGSAHQPAPRNDGAFAFVAETGTGGKMIQQMSVEGGEPQALVAGRDPVWSPKGGRLAYSASLGSVSQVFTAAAGGEAPFQITKEQAYAGQPAWSPDGARLAYVAEQDGNWDIWVITLDGGEPRRLTDDPGMDWAPAWSPDGSRLAFVSNRGGNHQLFVMRADGADAQPLTDFAQGAESPAWSPDGFWLAFVAYSGDASGVDARELYLMRADGQDPVRLTRNGFDDTEPAWIPVD